MVPILNDLLEVSPRVSEAQSQGQPVVALETTLITHGFPSPEGLEIALAMEEAVRSEGAVPATIGILSGKIIVGLSNSQIEAFAAADQPAKINLSNLAAQIASGGPGSATVATTLFGASLAGIRFFATGGIGGVHRGVAETGDVSADLPALARFPVAVVCAGAKAILDLPKTLEYLETLGVPVLGYQTEELPSFYRRTSGLRLDRGYEEVNALARAIHAHFQLGLGSGVVVGNPIPRKYEMEPGLYSGSLESALREFERSGLRGREVTPFLLARLRDLTEGSSAFSNRGLLLNNARVAARLASACARLGSPAGAS